MTLRSGATLALRSLHQSLARDGPRGVIDLGPLRFCDSAALVAIASVAEGLAANGVPCRVIEPRDVHARSYLTRMRVGQLLDDLGAQHALRPVREHRQDFLLELQRFDGPLGAERIAGIVYRLVRRRDAEVASAIFDGLCEIGENVTQHSGRTAGFVAAQRYPADGRLVFAIADSGIGMLRSLANSHVLTDRDAIDVALSRGGTSREEPHRGNGIPSVLHQATSFGGHLSVVSGAAHTTCHPHRRVYANHASSRFSGTLVQVEMRLPLAARPQRP